MKNTFGNTVTVTLFGESQGPAIGAVLDGLPPASSRGARPVRRSAS